MIQILIPSNNELNQDESFEISMYSKKTNSIQHINPILPILTHRISNSKILSYSWNIYQLNAPLMKGILSIELNCDDHLLLFARNNYLIPSLTEFDLFSSNGQLNIPIDFTSRSSWRIGVFNPDENHPSDYSLIVKSSFKDSTADIQNGDGADTRVTVFIWTNVVICGGLLLISLVWLIVWIRKAWIQLKNSPAYENLRNSE